MKKLLAPFIIFLLSGNVFSETHFFERAGAGLDRGFSNLGSTFSTAGQSVAFQWQAAGQSISSAGNDVGNIFGIGPDISKDYSDFKNTMAWTGDQIEGEYKRTFYNSDSILLSSYRGNTTTNTNACYYYYTYGCGATTYGATYQDYAAAAAAAASQDNSSRSVNPKLDYFNFTDTSPQTLPASTLGQ